MNQEITYIYRKHISRQLCIQAEDKLLFKNINNFRENLLYFMYICIKTEVIIESDDQSQFVLLPKIPCLFRHFM